MEKILDDVRRDALEKLRGEKDGMRDLEDAINTVLHLSRRARNSGLLSLEGKALNARSGYLRNVIMLVVDAYEPDRIVELGTNAYWADDPQGVQAMVYYIYLRGALDIQVGENPREILKLFQSILPSDPHWQISEQMVQYWMEPEKRFSQVRPVFQDADTLEQVAALEKALGALSDHALHMFIKDMEDYDLVDCVYALIPNKEMLEKLLLPLDGDRLRNIQYRVVQKHEIGDRDHIFVAGEVFRMNALREREEAFATRKEEVKKAEKILEEIRQCAMAAGSKDAKVWEKELDSAKYKMWSFAQTVQHFGLHKLEEEDIGSGFLRSLVTQVIKGVQPERIVQHAADTYWQHSTNGVQDMVAYIYLRGMVSIRQGKGRYSVREELESLIPKE